MKNTCIDGLIQLFEKALERLYKLRDAAREGTLMPFSLLPEKTAVELTTAHRTLEELWNSSLFQNEYKKMLHRDRTRRWRARKKQARETVTACDAAVTPGDDGVTFGDGLAPSGTDFAKKEKETEKRKNQRKEINKNKKTVKPISLTRCQIARAHVRRKKRRKRRKKKRPACLP